MNLGLKKVIETHCSCTTNILTSDTAFKNHIMAALEKSLGVHMRFSVANSP